MNGECGRRGRKEGAGRGTGDRGGPSLGSPIASELANAITTPCPYPFPYSPSPPWETSPLTGLPLNWIGRAAGCGQLRRRAVLTPPTPQVLGAKVQKGIDSDRDWQTARDIRRQRRVEADTHK